MLENVHNDAAGITITVSGMGGIISYEMEVIKRALIEAGIVVTVQDDHPMVDIPLDDNRWKYKGTVNEQLSNIKADIISGNISNTRIVRLVADHKPWGG